jgi:hypothetical protein
VKRSGQPQPVTEQSAGVGAKPPGMVVSSTVSGDRPSRVMVSAISAAEDMACRRSVSPGAWLIRSV